MTARAGVFMDCDDDVTGVTSNAEGGGGHTGGVTVGVAVEIGGVAGGAGPSRNCGNMSSATPYCQVWSGGVAHSAVVLVHNHWVIGGMTACSSNTGRGVSDTTQGRSANC